MSSPAPEDAPAIRAVIEDVSRLARLSSTDADSELLSDRWAELKQLWWDALTPSETAVVRCWPAFVRRVFPDSHERVVRAVFAADIAKTNANKDKRTRFERARSALGLSLGGMYLELGSTASSVGSLKIITSLRFSPSLPVFDAAVILDTIYNEMVRRHNDELCPYEPLTKDVTKTEKSM